MEIFFPHHKFLHGTILPRNPSPDPPLMWKVPPKSPVHVPITITLCEEWLKFLTCSPSSGDFGRASRPQDIIIKFFDHAEQNGCLKILIQ